MKQIVGQDIGSYYFDASAQTITISGVDSLSKENILMATNITDNTIIYQFNSTAKGGTFTGDVLTLTYDTTSMDDADDLQIYIDYPQAPSYIYKSNDVNSPMTYNPRGNMRNLITTSYYGTGYCLVNNYQNDSNGGGGLNMMNNTNVSGTSGILIAPDPGTVVYIDHINIFATVYNKTDITKPISATGASFQFKHTNIPYCRVDNLSDLSVVAGADTAIKDNLRASNLDTYIFKIPSIPAGRFSGNDGSYLQIRMSDGEPPDADNLSCLHLSFVMWVLNESEEA